MEWVLAELKFSTAEYFENEMSERSMFLLTLRFFIWLCIMQYENLSHKSDNVVSNPKIIMCSILKFCKGDFSTSCPFFPLPKMKIRISSQGLIKPPDFIRCIFPVAQWSIKGFPTNFTYQDFAVKINLKKPQCKKHGALFVGLEMAVSSLLSRALQDSSL